MSTKRIKASLTAALILTLNYSAGAMAQSVTPAPQAAVTLRLDQARAIAVQALEQGNPALALEIAAGLLQADAQSFFAHMLVAEAQHQLAQPAKARKSAVAAYRYATTKTQKFAASQLAARLAVEERRFTWSQFWLRRSLVNAPDPALRPQIEDDFRVVRAMNPLQFRLAFALAPSSNVNNGSDSAYALIDGVPLTGLFDGLSQALSGLTGSADLAFSYRLTQSNNSETRAHLRTYLSRVWLDEKSLTFANSFPNADVTNNDFSFASAETGLRHALRLDAAKGGGLVSGEVTAGKTWYGGAPYQHFGRAVVSYRANLADETGITIAAELEKRVFERGFNRPVLSRQLHGVLAHNLGNADRISLGISLRQSESDSRNANSTRKLAYVRYDMAEPVGPARLSFTLGAAQADYPDYAVGFIFVPGGRQDETLFGSVGFLFMGLDYAGFAPSLTIRAQQTRSNVSRFETSEVAVSLGIQSRF